MEKVSGSLHNLYPSLPKLSLSTRFFEQKHSIFSHNIPVRFHGAMVAMVLTVRQICPFRSPELPLHKWFSITQAHIHTHTLMYPHTHGSTHTHTHTHVPTHTWFHPYTHTHIHTHTHTHTDSLMFQHTHTHTHVPTHTWIHTFTHTHPHPHTHTHTHTVCPTHYTKAMLQLKLSTVISIEYQHDVWKSQGCIYCQCSQIWKRWTKRCIMSVNH